MKNFLLFAFIISGFLASAQTIISDGNCKAQFKYEVKDVLMSPVANTPIQFYNTSEGNITHWYWDFGDGNTSQEQNPMFVFYHPMGGPNVKLSPYRTVSLTIITSDTCKSYFSETINMMDGTPYVQPDCLAKYKYYQADFDSISGTSLIQFTNLSIGDSLKYLWQFEDGTTIIDKEPAIKFEAGKSEQKVCLTVSGINGSMDVFCDTVYLQNPYPPVPDPNQCRTAFGYKINYDVKTLLPALVLDFYSKASPDAVNWHWDFGDGSTSEEANPMHIFNYPVTIDSILADPNPFRHVCLTLKTMNGCQASYCETIDLYNIPLPVDTIKSCEARYKYAQISFDQSALTATFKFDNYSQGEALSYYWDFSNGTSSTDKEPVVTFNLNQLPIKVGLTVLGNNDCKDTFWEAVFPENLIIDPVNPDSSACYTSFAYKINYDIKTFAPALVLNFYSKFTPDAIDWSWNFDDGSVSKEQNPMHIYNLPLDSAATPGNADALRKVCLTVTTASGCTSTYCEIINIYMEHIIYEEAPPKCFARFVYKPALDIITIPELIPFRFYDVSEGDIVRRLWRFEDGSTSTEAEPLVNFDFQKPTQKVWLTAYKADNDSCEWSETVYVTNVNPDTIYNLNPDMNYSIHYVSSFPQQMSSCAGYVKAEVYLNGSPIDALDYSWSTGAMGQEAKGFCPTQTYTVIATAIDGTIVSGTFVFNADGSVTEAPFNWWVSGIKDNPMLKDQLYNNNYTVEWQLCDGTIVRTDSLVANSYKCGNEDATLIMKDSSGGIMYTEKVAMKALTTFLNPKSETLNLKLYPNPVKDVLNIQYSGKTFHEMRIEIYDMAGKNISTQKLFDVQAGQNISLNVKTLRNGVYLCKMISGNQLIATEKFSK